MNALGDFKIKACKRPMVIDFLKQYFDRLLIAQLTLNMCVLLKS